MLLALAGSLAIKRRRIWVRLHPSDTPGHTVVEIAGLARTDRAGWGREFDELAAELLSDDSHLERREDEEEFDPYDLGK